MYTDVQEEESSIDVSSPRDNNSPIVSEINIAFFAIVLKTTPIDLLFSVWSRAKVDLRE